MKILSLEIHNFSSYHGTHRMNFETESHLDGYAVFGHEGRGKTSIMRAILWCLYGEVKSSFHNGKEYVNRPLIDESQVGKAERMDSIAPLISDQAVKENKYDMYVTLQFESNGKRYTLKRETKPNPNPRNDKDIKIITHLSIDNGTVPPVKIPNVINQVIPERISRFFFIEMDAIERYANLLFGANADSSSIKSDIEAILGFPAIGRSKEDFSDLSKSYQNKIRNLKRRGTYKNGDLQKDIDSCDEVIRTNEAEIKTLESEVSKLKKEIQEKEDELSKQPRVQALMDRKKELEHEDNGLIPKLEKEIQRKYDSRKKKLSENAWLCLIQKKLESKILTFAEKRAEQNALVQEQGALKVEIAIAETRLSLKSDEEWECPYCEEKRASLNAIEREKLATSLVNLGERQKEISATLLEIGNPQSIVDSLSAFKTRNSGYIAEIEEVEFEIGEKVVELNQLKSELDDIESDIDENDEKLIAGLRTEIRNMTLHLGGKQSILQDVKLALDENKEKLKELEDKLEVSKIDRKLERSHSLNSSMFEWLKEGFSLALSAGRKTAKRSVESIANKTFLSTITESERYSSLTISENWEIEVLSKGTGFRARLDNPGHKQIVAVSLFDGLRTTSKRNYPTFFDNPGSNISDKVLDKMVTHFWNQDNGQVIMLSHGGGLREEESISKYGSSLAKAWRLSYRGDGLTSQINEVEL